LPAAVGLLPAAAVYFLAFPYASFAIRRAAAAMRHIICAPSVDFFAKTG